MNAPKLTQLAESLPATVPFVGPETMERARGQPFRARLGANENGFGPAPSVVAAMQEAAGDSWKYCDPENHDLKEALARHLGVASAQCRGRRGHRRASRPRRRGSMSSRAPRSSPRSAPIPPSTIMSPASAAASSPFPMRTTARIRRLWPCRPARERAARLFRQSRQSDGHVVERRCGRRVHRGPARNHHARPRRGLWRVRSGRNRCRRSMSTRPNVLRMRTFSKAYGLAGLRCGYAIGEAGAIRAFDKVRNHFGVNRMAQVAAEAALDDQAYLAALVARRPRRGGALPASPRRTGWSPCPRPPISSPSTAAATAHSPKRARCARRTRCLRQEADGAGARSLHPRERGA